MLPKDYSTRAASLCSSSKVTFDTFANTQRNRWSVFFSLHGFANIVVIPYRIALF